MGNERCLGQAAKISIAGAAIPVWFKEAKIRTYRARIVDEVINFHRGKSDFSPFFGGKRSVWMLPTLANTSRAFNQRPL